MTISFDKGLNNSIRYSKSVINPSQYKNILNSHINYINAIQQEQEQHQRQEQQQQQSSLNTPPLDNATNSFPLQTEQSFIESKNSIEKDKKIKRKYTKKKKSNNSNDIVTKPIITKKKKEEKQAKKKKFT